MKNHQIIFLAVSFFLIFSNFQSFAENQKPPIQLANIYRSNIDVTKYLVSEKLDGVHAYWDGEKLISRQGTVFAAPKWFTKNFPKEHLEGELWIGRGTFDELSGIVRSQIADDKNWQRIHLMLFDMPKYPGSFEQRLSAMKILVADSGSEYLQVIEQSRVSSHKELIKKLNEMVKQGAEGLMLHRADATYKNERNDDLLKLKTYQDEEAVVIAQIPGKGKYADMMGTLLVENSKKQRFKIGGGFSDAQRKSPPKIGTVITYKFYGKTNKGKPRFPTFMRVREDY